MPSWKAEARPKQIAPNSFGIWLIQTGRGWGKNKTAANTVIEKHRLGIWKHTALIGNSAADVRDLMIDPDRKNSGIMTSVTADFYPKYEPSKRQLVFPNGGICTAYSAEDPEQLRGPNHDSFWCDELAAWKPTVRNQTWNNLQFSCRLGESQGIVTTTPRPILLLKQIAQMPSTVVTRGSTFENVANLSKFYIESIVNPYVGTTIGRQELEGELLEENEMALFDIATIEANRITSIDTEELDLVVVGVDPTGSKEGHGCGIVCGGRRSDIGYLLADYSLENASPNQWAKKVIDAFDDVDANYIVVERNFGGDMVANTIRLVAQSTSHSPIPIKEVHASRGKAIRSEPISGLVQQGRIKHVGNFVKLEDQLYALESGEADDRADAYVWCFYDLLANRLRRVKPFAGDAKRIRSTEFEKDKARDKETAGSVIGNLWNHEW